MRNIITLAGVFIIIMVAVYLMFYREKLHVPNFNYDSGLGSHIIGQEWTQPQMIGASGTGGSPTPDQNLVYTKYKDDHVHDLYDYGSIFHIPTSVTDASDTTEDGLQALVIERSRFAKNTV